MRFPGSLRVTAGEDGTDGESLDAAKAVVQDHQADPRPPPHHS